MFSGGVCRCDYKTSQIDNLHRTANLAKFYKNSVYIILIIIMMDTILMILLGMFIGWNIPQPAYAKFIQDKVLGFFRNLMSKKD